MVNAIRDGRKTQTRRLASGIAHYSLTADSVEWVWVIEFKVLEGLNRN